MYVYSEGKNRAQKKSAVSQISKAVRPSLLPLHICQRRPVTVAGSVIQRKITIQDSNTQLNTVDEIQDFLKEHGWTVYLKMTNPLYNLSIENPVYHDNDDFFAQLTEYLEEELAFSDTPSQDDIQPKLAEVCKILFDQAPADPDINVEEIIQWLNVAGFNGLCGGWTEIHRISPDVLGSLWEKIRTWTPLFGQRGEVLESLNEHLHPYTAKNAAVMFLNAYNFHKLKENTGGDDDYGEIPAPLLHAIEPHLPVPEIPVGEYSSEDVSIDDFEAELQEHLEDGKIAVFSSESHYMSISRISDHEFTVMESETAGFVTRNSLALALAVIRQYMEGEEEEQADLCIHAT